MTHSKLGELQPDPPNRTARCRRHADRGDRKGGIVILLAVLLPVIFIMAAFVINISYLQLARTELLIATDASARAAGRAWSYYQDIDDAIAAARVTAALNDVAGSPLMIDFADASNDVEFGDNNISTTSNRFEFTKVDTGSVRNQTQHATAVRVNGKFNGSSMNGMLNSLFPGMGLKDQFRLHQTSTATQLDRDIALVLDRSGSMGWITFDWPSGTDPWETAAMDAAVAGGVLSRHTYWDDGEQRTYYRYTSGNNQTSYYQYVWEHHFNLGPAPQKPWDELVVAVDTFLDVLETTDQDEQVALATYSSSGRLDLHLVKDFDRIRNKLDNINVGGSTAIGYGMQAGLPSLLDSTYARPYAAKTFIVMTDGMHNRGTDPVQVAQQISNQYNFTIHSITFGPNADKNRMRQVAAIGGGKYYHAETGQDLQAIFDEIANNLPTLITQ